MKSWQRTRTKTEIAKLVVGAPQANGARRRVTVTRYSSSEPDEIAVDLIGGKAVLDVLVSIGVLAGDSRKHLDREARWIRCAKGEGRLVVEVEEV